MPNTRVMVVDDSAAMRALFCDILDNANGVAVCGTASNADEAREKLAADILAGVHVSWSTYGHGPD